MIIYFKTIETPLGTLYGGACEEGICFTEFIDEDKVDAAVKRWSKELRAELVPGDHAFLLQLEEEFKTYFDKKITEFTVPLYLSGTDFQKLAWKSLLQIPYGKTWTYKEQAIKLDNLPAIRAIAAANGQNRHGIIIPCHRVIGSNGSLTGYAGGLSRKAWLLKHEANPIGQTFEIPFE